MKVDNLTQNTTVTLNTGDILHLGTVGINEIGISNENLQIYPNPMQGKAELSFNADKDGDAQISIIDIAGKEVMHTSKKLTKGIQKFLLTGLKQGMYFINISNETYFYTSKLISQNTFQTVAKIEFTGSENSTTTPNNLKSTKATVNMAYTAGDRLLFKGISGNYSNIVTDIPTASKTITFSFTACSDYDNNNYATVQIGTQTWMAENLKTTKYTNGISIPIITDNSAWATLTTGAYCNYNNDTNNAAAYGRLYNWYAVTDSRNLCPAGWHSPSDAEFTILTSYLGGEFVAGGKLKETTTLHWQSPNSGATNESGFTALPAGGRNNDGIFPSNDIGYRGNWWSTTQNNTTTAWYRGIENINGSVMRNFYYNTTGFSVRCVKGGSLATLTTSSVTGITIASAVSGGNITSDGGLSVTARGVCWSLHSNPSLTNSFSTDGSGIGNFTSILSGLMSDSNYFIKAYASNSIGTAYGNEICFATTAPPVTTVTDYDGNVYDTVHIGTQVWMKQNLKTTHYKNGTIISNVIDSIAWTTLATGAYCDYNNTPANSTTYGRLYNWYAVNTGNICPTGWHVPTDAEWTTLTTYLGGENIAGGKLKEVGLSHWLNPNTAATNETGFSALPGGNRYSDGVCSNMHYNGSWWSSTENIATSYSWNRLMGFNYSNTYREYSSKASGFSVRCVKGGDLATLTTSSVTGIAFFSAVSGGNITSDGGSPVSVRGICWSLFPNPSLSNSFSIDGSGIGNFTSILSGLMPDSNYFIKAYATNSIGTAYGNEVSFTTLLASNYPVVDFDGNGYDTVHIGSQIWMAENLKTTHYKNGTSIVYPGANDAAWQNNIIGAYAWYNNDEATYKNIYGALYNWYVVNTGNLCPSGWHVPTDAEWTTLCTYLGGGSIAGGKLKEAGLAHWVSPNTAATNETGFTALPGGGRYYTGTYGDIGSLGNWWSSTEYNTATAWNKDMGYLSSYADRYNANKADGFSVRCVKD